MKIRKYLPGSGKWFYHLPKDRLWFWWLVLFILALGISLTSYRVGYLTAKIECYSEDARSVHIQKMPDHAR